MPALPLTAFFFQDAAASGTDVHLIMIAVWIIAICILLVILGVVVGALIAVSKITKLVKTTEAKAQPLIGKGQEIAGHVNEIISDLKPKIASISADLQPKIASVTSDVQHISGVVRSKVDEAGQTFTRVNETVQGYNETAKDVNSKTKAQVQRVNGMVSDALTTTEHVSKQIQHGIRVPVEKVASWVTAAKIGIEHLSETLGARIPFLRHDPGPKARAAGAGPVRTTPASPGQGVTTSAPVIPWRETGSGAAAGATTGESPVKKTPPVG